MELARHVARPESAPGTWSVRRVTILPFRHAPGSPPAVFEPPTDVYQTCEGITVRLEVAGLQPEDLEVTVAGDGRALRVAGHRSDPAAGSPRKYYNLEIQTGDFARVVALPGPVDLERVSAQYSNGFLEIFLPLRAGGHRSGRQVPVE